MAEDFIENVRPTEHVPPVELPHETRPPEPPERARGIRGRVVAINRGHRHAGESHALDVTVGGGEMTEIVVRVPNAPYAELEGADVVIFRAR